MSHSFRSETVARFLGLLLFFSVGFADRDVRIAPFLLEAAAEVVVTAIYGAGTAFTGNEVVAVFGFNLVATDVAANCVFNNH